MKLETRSFHLREIDEDEDNGDNYDLADKGDLEHYGKEFEAIFDGDEEEE
ncbi:hypothetical protein BDQ17DRAFT_1427778 [Cyathus striatus]|nr:hypothetical protein BDQ17DRAFT_1427778 [Cyathus striatus]